MTGPCFVDTNVLVYHFDVSDAAKQRQARAWISGLWERDAGRVSFQVLAELYAVVMKRFSRTIQADQVRPYIRDLLS